MTGSRSTAIRGYVPEEPAAQCEGTCARDRNYLISDQTWSNGTKRDIVVTAHGFNTGSGRPRAVAQYVPILVSMSQSTVVSCPQVIQQLSPENNAKAHVSQVTLILSQTGGAPGPRAAAACPAPHHPSRARAACCHRARAPPSRRTGRALPAASPSLGHPQARPGRARSGPRPLRPQAGSGPAHARLPAPRQLPRHIPHAPPSPAPAGRGAPRQGRAGPARALAPAAPAAPPAP
jgi:hypothetical protein